MDATLKNIVPTEYLIITSEYLSNSLLCFQLLSFWFLYKSRMIIKRPQKSKFQGNIHSSTNISFHHRNLYMYKVVHGLTDANFTRLLSKERPTRRTNSQNCFRNVKANKNCYRSFLPDQVRNAASVDSFKSCLTSNVNFEKLLCISHYYD